MPHEGAIDERLDLVRHPPERSDSRIRPLWGDVVLFGQRCQGHARHVGVCIPGQAQDRIDVDFPLR